MHTTERIVAVGGAATPLAVPAAATNGDGDVDRTGPTAETSSDRPGPPTGISGPVPGFVGRLPGAIRGAVTDVAAAGTVG